MFKFFLWLSLVLVSRLERTRLSQIGIGVKELQNIESNLVLHSMFQNGST